MILFEMSKLNSLDLFPIVKHKYYKSNNTCTINIRIILETLGYGLGQLIRYKYLKFG